MNAVARSLGLDSVAVANRIRDSADQLDIRIACTAREDSRRKRIQDACRTIRISRRIRPRAGPAVMEHVDALPLDVAGQLPLAVPPQEPEPVVPQEPEPVVAPEPLVPVRRLSRRVHVRRLLHRLLEPRPGVKPNQ